MSVVYSRRLLYRYKKLNPYEHSTAAFVMWPLRGELANLRKAMRSRRIDDLPSEFGVFNTRNQKAAVERSQPAIPFWALWSTNEKIRYFSVIPGAFIYAALAGIRNGPKKFVLYYVLCAFNRRSSIYQQVLKRLDGKTIHISSDHQGPVFELFNRRANVTTVYHTHGVNLIPWTAQARLPESEGAAPVESIGCAAIGVFFNSVQPARDRYRILRLARRQGRVVAVRYHPRRPAGILERLYINTHGVVRLDDLSLDQAIRYSSRNWCCNSSVLLQSFLARPEETYWLRSSPPFTDFYKLDGTVKEVVF